MQVLGVAALDVEELRPEAERKGDHAHADAPGHQEMAQLVHENQDAEDEEER